ncbi:hypothetical protein BWZ20_14885 [Winogradskyella sp. J14-2]|uniref:hypothetical protein n=1 Tax=Winogradskyella sp. J14-2 TaxID=1936080 RepID=UPI000972AF20|nr:hypothetical protein [Winogradskyella sp. J14-2]APY09509.1 hypothetical protein BWZ20_14885 [Winogradskyella sp. J14-2]
MSLHLIIKTLIVITFGLQLRAQGPKVNDIENSKIPILFDDSRQYLGSVSLAYQLPIPYGNNFIGKGFKGRDGYNFKFHFYIFKNLYAGFSYGFSSFNNNSPELLGNYGSTQTEEIFGTLGYEFVPISKVRLGIFTSILGRATLSNSIPSGNGNHDSGKLSNLGINLEYEFIKNLNIYIEYNWRKIKTNIRVPEELSPFFRTGTYNALNFGIKFNFGNADMVDKIIL